MIHENLRLIHAIIIMISCYYSSIQAEEMTDIPLEELFQIQTTQLATGQEQSLQYAPATTTVITAQDIEAIGATDLDEILETVAGLHVSRFHRSYTPIYSIRGIYTQTNPQILVLINNIPITNLFFGNRSNIWGGMPINMIAKIEVIRGPSSALYGAEAFAGVINIMTKTAEHIQGTEIGGRIGSFDSQSAWFLTGDFTEHGDYAVGLEYFQTDGFDQVIEQDAQTGFDQIFGTQASLAPKSVQLRRDNLDLRFDLNYQNWQIRSGWQHRNNVGTGAGIAEAIDPEGEATSNRVNFDLQYLAPKQNHWQLSGLLALFYSDQEIQEDFRLNPVGSNLGFGEFTHGVLSRPEVFEYHIRTRLLAEYDGWNKHKITLGIGHHYGNLYKVKSANNFGLDPNTGQRLPPTSPIVDKTDTPFAFLSENDRHNSHILMQDIWQFAQDWELTTGLRYDYFSDFDSVLNPRIALVWTIDPQLTSKLLYGQAFRAPSFIEQFAINNPVSLGNPDLAPETIRTIEWSLHYQQIKYQSSINLFYYQWQDIIRFIPDQGQNTNTAQNTGKQTGYGLELEARWQITDKLMLMGNYAYQRSIDDSTDKNAGNSPSHQLYLRTGWNIISDWHLNLQLNGVFDRKRPPNDSRPEIKDYIITDVSIRRKYLYQHLDIALIVKNIFDQTAKEPSTGLNARGFINIPNDLPLAGRRITAELKYHF